MKKTLILISLWFFIFKCFSQGKFPNETANGNANQEIFQLGASGSATGFHFRYNYPDTFAANAAPFIKSIPNFVIVANDTLRKRSNDATKWQLIGGSTSAGGGGTVISVSGLSPLFAVSNPTTTPTFSLSNTTAYTVFGRGIGTGVPSYIGSLDSNWFSTGYHTENYFNTKYLPIGTPIPPTVTNVGAGFRWVISNVNQHKTVANSYGFNWDSATANVLTPRIDSAKWATLNQVGVNNIYTAYVDTLGNNSTAQLGNPAKPYATIQGALDANTAVKQLKIKIGLGQFATPPESSMRENVIFQGSGQPSYNNNSITVTGFNQYTSTTPTALIGGTILHGAWFVVERANVQILDMGLDVGSDWVANKNGGVAAEGLLVAQNYTAGGLDGFHPSQESHPPKTGFVLRNFSMLGTYGTVHGIVIESQKDAVVQNVKSCVATYNLVLKVMSSNVSNVILQGSSACGLYLKDNYYAYFSGVKISNIDISQFLNTETGGGVFIGGETNSNFLTNLEFTNFKITLCAFGIKFINFGGTCLPKNLLFASGVIRDNRGIAIETTMQVDSSQYRDMIITNNSGDGFKINNGNYNSASGIQSTYNTGKGFNVGSSSRIDLSDVLSVGNTGDALTYGSNCYVIGVTSVGTITGTPTQREVITSAPKLTTPRTIGTVTGDATSAGSSFDGTANNSNALTLATVNSNPGSFTNANITVNAKGLITAASSGSSGGAVSSVSNSDGTLTISPTTGNVVGSLALGHANTWSGKQTLNVATTTLGVGTNIGSDATHGLLFAYYNGNNYALWPANVTPSSSNYSFLINNSGTSTQFNSTDNVEFNISDATKLQVNNAGNILINNLKTGGSAPTTSGTTRTVVSDANGLLSFITTPIGTVTSVATGYGLSGGTITTTGTLLLDSSTLFITALRRKDSLTTTNPFGYVTKKILSDTAAAIRASSGGSSVASLTATAVGYGNSSNQLYGDAAKLNFDTSIYQLAIPRSGFGASSLLFSQYSSVGSLYNGAGFIFATNCKPDPANSNKLIKINGADMASFAYARYDRGFEVHTGITGSTGSSFDDTQNTRLVVDNSGNVGIGTTTPSAKLHVNGTFSAKTDSYGPVGLLGVNSSDIAYIGDYDGFLNGNAIAVNDGAGTISYTASAGHTFYANVQMNNDLNVDGTITGAYSPSDRRFKKNISPILNSLEVIRNLGVYRYQYDTSIKKNLPSGVQLGVIAQEVEKVIPDIVKTGKDGFKSVNYLELIPLLIGAIKEQQAQIEDLQKQINEIKQLSPKRIFLFEDGTYSRLNQKP